MSQINSLSQIDWGRTLLELADEIGNEFGIQFGQYTADYIRGEPGTSAWALKVDRNMGGMIVYYRPDALPAIEERVNCRGLTHLDEIRLRIIEAIQKLNGNNGATA